MRNHDGHPARHELVEPDEHFVLRPRVERRSRLVQDEQLRRAHVGARERDLLPLPTREIHTVVEPPAEHLSVAVRETWQETRRQRPVRRVHQRIRRGLRAPRRCIPHVRQVAGHAVDLADADVLVEAHVVAHEVLEDDADRLAQRREVVVADIHAVEQDAALRGVVEPCKQLRDRRLAGPVLAYERDALARHDAQVHVPDRPPLAAGILEADVLEHEPRANRRRDPRRTRPRADRGLHLEEDEQVLQVQTLLVDVARRQQQPLDEVATPAERRREKGERAETDGARHGTNEDGRVRAVVPEGADE